MGWFEEQIKDRRAAEQRDLEDAFEQIAGVVLGKMTADRLNDKRVVAQNVIEEILKYYGCKSVEYPSSIQTGEEQLDYALRHYGMMRRNVVLEEKWYKDAFGAMIAFTKDDHTPVALLPNMISGYSFTDPHTGERIMAVSSPMIYSNGEVIGVLRYVTSMRRVDMQIAKIAGLATIALIVVLFVILISRNYLIHLRKDLVGNGRC